MAQPYDMVSKKAVQDQYGTIRGANYFSFRRKIRKMISETKRRYGVQYLNYIVNVDYLNTVAATTARQTADRIFQLPIAVSMHRLIDRDELSRFRAIFGDLIFIFFLQQTARIDSAFIESTKTFEEFATKVKRFQQKDDVLTEFYLWVWIMNQFRTLYNTHTRLVVALDGQIRALPAGIDTTEINYYYNKYQTHYTDALTAVGIRVDLTDAGNLDAYAELSFENKMYYFLNAGKLYYIVGKYAETADDIFRAIIMGRMPNTKTFMSYAIGFYDLYHEYNEYYCIKHDLVPAEQITPERNEAVNRIIQGTIFKKFDTTHIYDYSMRFVIKQRATPIIGKTKYKSVHDIYLDFAIFTPEPRQFKILTVLETGNIAKTGQIILMADKKKILTISKVSRTMKKFKNFFGPAAKLFYQRFQTTYDIEFANKNADINLSLGVGRKQGNPIYVNIGDKYYFKIRKRPANLVMMRNNYHQLVSQCNPRPRLGGAPPEWVANAYISNEVDLLVDFVYWSMQVVGELNKYANTPDIGAAARATADNPCIF